MSTTTTLRPFQRGDRVLVTDRYRDPATGVIDSIRPRLNALGHVAFIWLDDDPERSRYRLTVDLSMDMTAAASPVFRQIELWDGGINGASTGIDTYDCPVDGCDFNVSAVGTPDTDEPDYFTEGIEAHERWHVDIDASTAAEAIAEVQVPHPGEIDMGPLVRSSSQAGLQAHRAARQAVPALVQLDEADAAHRLADAVALVLDDVALVGAGIGHRNPQLLALTEALADFRKAAGR